MTSGSLWNCYRDKINDSSIKNNHEDETKEQKQVNLLNIRQK